MAVLCALLLAGQDPPPEGKLRWSLGLGVQAVSLSRDLNTMIVRTNDGFARVDPGSGREKWRVKLDGMLDTPSVGKHVYAPIGNFLVAFELGNGKEAWRWPDPGINKSPLILESFIVQRRQDRVQARSTDNKDMWQTMKVGGDLHAGPGGQVWAVTETEITSLTAGSGKLRWQAKPPPEELFRDIVYDRSVLIAATNGGIAAYEADRGQMLWSQKLGVVYGDPVLEGSVVGATYTSGGKSFISAHGRKDGARAWQIECPARARLALRDRVLYWAARGEVAAHDAAGKELWRTRVFAASEGDADVRMIEGALVMQYGPRVAQLGTDGKVLWVRKLSAESPPVNLIPLRNGVVLAGNCDAIELAGMEPKK